jgi:hypothetical protein
MSPIFRTIRVTPIPTKNHPIAYRAKYRRYAAYGRTPIEAVERVKRQYYRHRITPKRILNAIGFGIFNIFS